MEYLEAVKESGIEVGDKVRVVRAWGTHEGGWRNSWAMSMGKSVGFTYIVEGSVDEVRGLRLECIGFNWPIYSLELVEKAEKIMYEEFKEGDTIKVVGRTRYAHALLVGSVGVVTRINHKDVGGARLSYRVESPTQSQNLHPVYMEHWDG